MREDLLAGRELDTFITDVSGAMLERDVCSKAGNLSLTSPFLQNGYFVIDIDPVDIDKLSYIFDPSLQIPFNRDDIANDYWGATDLSDEVVDRLNLDHRFFSPPTAEGFAKLSLLLENISPIIESQILTPFRIINCRAVETFPSVGFGPTDWHSDGPPRLFRKILMYPNALNEELGSIDIHDRYGNEIPVKSDGPIALLYDSAVLLHRGRPGKGGPRPMLEVTISPSIETDPEPRFAGQNARVPKINSETLRSSLHSIYYEAEKRLEKLQVATSEAKKPSKKGIFLKLTKAFSRNKNNKAPSPNKKSQLKHAFNFVRNVNIGGGPNFHHQEWLNFDSVDGSALERGIYFSPETVLPVAMRTVEVVYTSHCLEHLDDATVDRLLSEARRILSLDGSLLVKIPDFSRVLAAYEDGDTTFFANQWGVETVNSGWAAKGVEDTIAARAAFIFCGYWNREYVGEFGSPGPRQTGAYHGPPPVGEDGFRRALGLKDPPMISKKLTQAASAQSDFSAFNHQNAWTEEQFEDLLKRNGFTVETCDPGAILTRFADVPDLTEMRNMSSYFWATPYV